MAEVANGAGLEMHADAMHTVVAQCLASSTLLVALICLKYLLACLKLYPSVSGRTATQSSSSSLSSCPAAGINSRSAGSAAECKASGCLQATL